MHPQISTVRTTDQQTLCCKAWGHPELPALVLVHGYPDNQEVWEPIIQELIQHFYIVTALLHKHSKAEFSPSHSNLSDNLGVRST